MKVRELIEELQKLDQDAQVWEMYDPPCACGPLHLYRLDGENTWYAEMFKEEGVKVGDYAVICG